MSCFKNIFKCNVSESSCDKQIVFLRQKMVELDMELKNIKMAHQLEIKRIEDKLITQMNILTTKIDNLALLLAGKN